MCTASQQLTFPFGSLHGQQQTTVYASAHYSHWGHLAECHGRQCQCWQSTTASGVQDSPKQDMGASGSVSSLIGPRFLMIGDAAHSVKPDLGQGCNSGLQDGHIFSQVGVC